MTTPQARYYAKHREELLPKMREREKSRRVTRQSKYDENPALHEEDKEKMRKKYYNRVASTNRRLMADALATDIPESLRTLLSTMMEEKTAITTAALRKMISPPLTNQMAKSKKDEVKSEEGAAVPLVEKKEEEVKEKKPRKPRAAAAPKRRVIEVADGEEIVFKVEKGPIKVSF